MNIWKTLARLPLHHYCEIIIVTSITKGETFSFDLRSSGYHAVGWDDGCIDNKSSHTYSDDCYIAIRITGYNFKSFNLTQCNNDITDIIVKAPTLESFVCSFPEKKYLKIRTRPIHLLHFKYSEITMPELKKNQSIDSPIIGVLDLQKCKSLGILILENVSAHLIFNN